MNLRFLLCCAVLLLVLPAPVVTQQASTGGATFHNPLLASGPDPWVIMDGGFYYFMATTARNLTIRRTRNLADLAHAEAKVVWTPPVSGPYSKDIWAPELHRLEGKWYIYFAADGGANETHRIYVIENAAANPLEGDWTFKGQVNDATNKWAIDPTVFEDHGKRYMLWSGWEGDTDGEQRIYIARMSNPWTIDSARTELSRPQFPWEQVGDTVNRPAMPHVNVNEGPEVLQHGDRIFLVYSASACWTDSYEMGMLEAKSGSKLLKAKSWSKVDYPVFKQDPAKGVYATGHNGFFKSPNGKEDWFIYHANSRSGQGCGPRRSPRMQPFTWKPDGTPYFGTPVQEGTELRVPGGM